MCPECFASAMLIFGSVISAGGTAALVASKFRRKNPAQDAPTKEKEKENEDGQREE